MRNNFVYTRWPKNVIDYRIIGTSSIEFNAEKSHYIALAITSFSGVKLSNILVSACKEADYLN